MWLRFSTLLTKTNALYNRNVKKVYFKPTGTLWRSRTPIHKLLVHKRNFFSSQLSSRTPGTFVSSHYAIDPLVVISYLQRKNLVFKENVGELILRDCPWCHNTKEKEENFWKLYISKVNGTYFCHRCGSKGSWFDFQRHCGDIKQIEDKPSETIVQLPPLQKLERSIEQLKNPKFAAAYKYLTQERMLSPEIIDKYQVGTALYSFQTEGKWEDHMCITFPWLNYDKKGNLVLTRIKVRSIASKQCQKLDPAGGQWGLFGWHLVPADATEIILTEGEFDAMSVMQQTGRPAVSLPNGANSLPVAILEKLERFQKIYLWMDDDVVGQEGAQKFATKLGFPRVYLVHTKDGNPNGPKDANDALRKGIDLQDLLEKASRIPHKQILDFRSLKDQVYRELANPDQVAGRKCTSLPTLNTILQGHRRGELTIITGPTGIGKTSIISQLSLDYCMQGVNTLWGSFEINNVRLVKKMMSQFAVKDLEHSLDEFEDFATKFSQLPMYFMKFFGSSGMDEVMDAMDYAVYVYDVEHVVLDNLQFMTSGQGRGFERFEFLDASIEKFRKFASLRNVHITLVIHPRKEDENRALSTSSVFGTAKATQEADNVLIIQKGKFTRYLEVTKNRFSGRLGKIPYRFDPETNKIYERTPREMDELRKNFKKTHTEQIL